MSSAHSGQILVGSRGGSAGAGESESGGGARRYPQYRQTRASSWISSAHSGQGFIAVGAVRGRRRIRARNSDRPVRVYLGLALALQTFEAAGDQSGESVRTLAPEATALEKKVTARNGRTKSART